MSQHLKYANDTTLKYTRNYTTLMAENEEDLKTSFRKVKEESTAAALMSNSKRTKITSTSPVKMGLINGEEVEMITDDMFLGL